MGVSYGVRSDRTGERVLAVVRGPQVLRPCARPLTLHPLPWERVLKVLIYSIRTAYLAFACLRIVTWVLSPVWRFCSIRSSTCSVMVFWFGSTLLTVAVVIAAPAGAVQ